MRSIQLSLFRNRTHAALVAGESSHQSANPASKQYINENVYDNCPPRACFSKLKYRNFLGLFRMPPLPLHLRKAEAVTIKLRNPLSFSYIKNISKGQLFETSRLQLDNWLFGPEKISGLLRNRPLTRVSRSMVRANRR